jgi:phage tail-like protein
MDVNGTRFHLLLTRSDWGDRCTADDGQKLAQHFSISAAGVDAAFSWDDRRNELTLGKRVFYFTSTPGNQPANLDARRGAAADVYGNVYWIAPSGNEILVNSSGTRTTTHFWSSLDGMCERKDGLFWRCFGDGEAQPLAFRGLAVTTQHYLVAGTLDPPGLVIFDLDRGGEPRQLLWPSDVPFAPFDFAAATDGGLWILDRDNSRVWRLDRTFGVVGSAAVPAVSPFMAIDGSTPAQPCARSVITESMAMPVSGGKPIAIEALPDGSILVMIDDGTSFSLIVRFKDGVRLGDASTSEARALIEQSKRASFTLFGHDFAYVDRLPDGTEHVLFVVGQDGDQAVAFTLDIEHSPIALKALADFYPMRLFGSKGIIVGANQPLYDSQQLWVPLIAQKRSRFVERGRFVISKIDGKEPRCVWHRLMIDACIPPECEVLVESRASDEEALLPFAEWMPEPRPLRRPTGSELAWSNDTRGAGIDTWELLFQRARGRHLELRLTLQGSTRTSPRLRALRIWYPRFSYLEHYLPAVYREEQTSASFVERFLANIEGFFTTTEDKAAAAQCLFDYRCAPADTLEWLATWFGVALDPAWNEAKRRLFIRFAAEFFEWRGTVPGLLMALRLVMEECADESIFSIHQELHRNIRLVEKFRTRGLPAVVFGDTSDTPAGLPLRARMEKWDATLGASDLHERWKTAIADPSAQYPVRPPSDDRRAAWETFSRQTLGFVPRAGDEDVGLWREVLQRRYPSLQRLNNAWNTTYLSWDEVELPTELPTGRAALSDWIQFEGIVLPARSLAHRFTVFLPQGTLGLADRDARLDLARRVIALEKPAHTSFEVKFFWAFFRVGEARVGEETIVDLGSRSPELLSPFVLNRNYLGSGWLADERATRSQCPCSCSTTTTGGCR